MTDLTLIIGNATKHLSDIRKQVSTLANGLQNAAPSSRRNEPNPSVQYLFETAKQLSTCEDACKSILSPQDNLICHSQLKLRP
jgi:hypothetical protein